ncbi:MAG TPA: fatty acid desaturase [Solirubrobacteraceae bacterium]|nr:fatty acid desaturase [Solirubrobacteraceae bacterium]
MTRLERNVNLAAVLIPPIGILAGAPLLWGSLLHLRDLVIAIVLYLLTGFGITVGYHRLLTHRAFATHRWLERGLALAGALALQGSPSDWVADHRRHHAHTDADGDPHSPHVGHGAGLGGALRGLWHAHVGWLWRTQGQADGRRYAPELYEDAFMRSLHRRYHWFALGTFAAPFLLGLALTGTWSGALTALLWGGLIRVFLIHHVTWSVNSVCHFFGRRRFPLDDHSTNLAWLALPSLGEAWHHNHHAFARSAFHGLKRSEALLDPSGWVIRLMRRAGLAWNVIEIAPARQAARAQKSTDREQTPDREQKSTEPVQPPEREPAELTGAAA